MSNDIRLKDQVFLFVLFSSTPILAYFDIPNYRSIVSVSFILYFCFLFLTNIFFRHLCKSGLSLILLSLYLYHYYNAIQKKAPEVNIIDLLHSLKAYSSFCICFFFCSKYSVKVFRIFTFAFFVKILYMFIFLYIISGISGRLTGAGYSATGVGQSASHAMIFLIYLYSLDVIDFRRFFFFSLLPFVIVMLSQSRNSLATYSMCVIGSYFIYIFKENKGFQFKHFLILIFAIICVFVGMSYFQDSDFGQRVQDVSETYEEGHMMERYGTGTIFDQIVGDRLIYYVNGWELFLQNPITGIGYSNYRFVTGGVYPLHSEYMIHICEGGIIAIVIWLIFHFYIIKTWYDSEVQVPLKISSICSIVVILFCAIYAREFTGEQYSCMYGIIASFKYINFESLNKSK